MASDSPFAILLHHDFPKDLKGVPANMQKRILDAVEKRLAQAPDQYGERLRQSLRGYWKLRVGDFRVVYEIFGRQVRVYGVMDRREVYAEIVKRTTGGWLDRPPEGVRRRPRPES